MDIDMKQEYLISGFTYFPAPPAGFIESYVVQVSRDGEKWETVHRGTYGNFRNDPGLRTVLFDGEFPARYLRLSGLRPPGGLTRVGAAEIEVLSAVGD